MSELHTYRILYSATDGTLWDRTDIAFSAEDALTQFRVVCPTGNVKGIVPVPDKPAVPDERADAERVPVIRRPETTTFAQDLQQAREYLQARGILPSDRVEGLESELRKRTEERDYAHRMLAEARRHREALMAAIYGPGGEPKRIVSPDDAVAAAARIARETREERDRLGRAVLESDAECMRLRADRDAKETIIAQIDEAISEGMSTTYVSGDLARIVREICAERWRFRRERDALQKRLDAGITYLQEGGMTVDRLRAVLEGTAP